MSSIFLLNRYIGENLIRNRDFLSDYRGFKLLETLGLLLLYLYN